MHGKTITQLPGNRESAENQISLENARIEYTNAHNAYIHYDNYSWQVGSVLIAGVFVYWGFIMSANTMLQTRLIGNLLICGMMSVWMFYTEHNRQIYLYKLHRIYELEELLNMHQHRRFKDYKGVKKIYILSKPQGHILDGTVYTITSFGGLLPCLLNMKLDDWTKTNISFLSLTLIIVISVICRIHSNDRKVKSIIESLSM